MHLAISMFLLVATGSAASPFDMSEYISVSSAVAHGLASLREQNGCGGGAVSALAECVLVLA